MSKHSIPFVSVHLMGGLGNQLFQIFATIAEAKQCNVDFIFPYSSILPYNGPIGNGTPRYTYWHSLLDNLLNHTTYIDNLNQNNPTMTNDDIDRYMVLKENGFHYTPLPERITSNVKLFGYYQSYKYFEREFREICELVGIPDQRASVRLIYRSRFEPNTHTISMHFRLGDYKALQHCHPIMSFEYYEKALSLIVTSRPPLTKFNVLYFCEKDDNAQVNETIRRLQSIQELENVQYSKVNDDIEDYQQMLLMSCCDDHIIANSSFSWWGAYFNTGENKIVCYPSRWFGPAITADVRDLFPPSWQKILC